MRTPRARWKRSWIRFSRPTFGAEHDAQNRNRPHKRRLFRRFSIPTSDSFQEEYAMRRAWGLLLLTLAAGELRAADNKGNGR